MTRPLASIALLWLGLVTVLVIGHPLSPKEPRQQSGNYAAGFALGGGFSLGAVQHHGQGE